MTAQDSSPVNDRPATGGAGAGSAAAEAAVTRLPEPETVRALPAGTTRIETYGAVAHVVLDRPESMNSLTPDSFTDLIAAGRAVAEDSSVNAVVLRGEGRAFCAGLDMGQFARLAEGRSPGERLDVPGEAKAVAQQAVEVWTLVPVPVIAAIHGPALGGGFQIALGADIRVSAPDAGLALMEVEWGIIPDMMGTQLLPRLVGPSRAKHLIFTGAIITGEEACRWGAVDEVSETPQSRAHALAAEIADKSRPALAAAKRLIGLSASASLAEGLAAEQTELAALKGSEEQKAAAAKRMAYLRARKERKRAQG